MLMMNAPVFDINGHIEIDNPNPEGLAQFSRRVSRAATLDGGAAINDFGYSPADRTLEIEWTPRSLAEADNARRMVQAYGRLIVSWREGCFLVAPQDFDEADNAIIITALVERQLDA